MDRTRPMTASEIVEAGKKAQADRKTYGDRAVRGAETIKKIASMDAAQLGEWSEQVDPADTLADMAALAAILEPVALLLQVRLMQGKFMNRAGGNPDAPPA